MTPVPRIRRRLWVVPGLLALATITGCTKPLLAPDEPRSQFDNYDKIRSQFADQTTEDAFGHPKPNLRGRLLPKE